jgi:hypothetical protein
MWCDDFDADLLKVVPGAAEALGEAAGIRMWTYSSLVGGKINCPSSWNTDFGSTAFFWTCPEGRPGPTYWTEQRVAGCTLLEAIRDEWIHTSVVVVDHYVAWRPPVRDFEKLMYDVRGWRVLADGERETIREQVRSSLREAAARVTELTGVSAGETSREKA